VDLYLVLPLVAGLLYASSALLLKLAERRGIGAGRITILSNLANIVAFAAFYPWDQFPAAPAVWWPVWLLALTMLVGQVSMVLAFTRGDVSVATPALATKVVLVAALATVVAPRTVGAATWAAAVLMLVGLWLLLGRPGAHDRRRALVAVAFSLVAATSFACFDLLVQVWSERIGFGLLLTLAMTGSEVLSLPLWWALPGPGAAADAPGGNGRALWPLVIGSALMAIQSVLFVWTIGRFHDAPGANVVYASRGIWSVLLVQMLPAWFGGVEVFTTRGTFARRIAGATVMLLGVVLAFS
jgi:drug/metabolite transporter (DMT)-like permease